MTRRLRPWVLAAPISLVGLVACQAILSIEDEPGVGRDLPLEDSGETSTSGCVGASPPPKPTTVGAKATLHYFAMRDISSAPAADRGYNLDGRCTYGDADIACVPPSTADTTKSEDSDGGIDNALAKISRQLSPISGDPLFKSANNAIGKGREGLILTLADLDDEGANDDAIGLSMTRAPLLGARSAGAPPGCSPKEPIPAGSDDFGPLWNGCDEWQVRDQDKDFGAKILRQGYMAGGLVVVDERRSKSPSPTFTIQFGPLELPIYRALFTARLARTNGSLELEDGWVGGRVRVSDILTAATRFEIGSARVCDDPRQYDLVRGLLCDHRDVSAQTEDPNAPCDSVTVGFTFTANEVLPYTGDAGSTTAEPCTGVDLRCPN